MPERVTLTGKALDSAISSAKTALADEYYAASVDDPIGPSNLRANSACASYRQLLAKLTGDASWLTIRDPTTRCVP